MTLLTRLDLASLPPDARSRITRRSAVPDPDVRRGAADICQRVLREGDAAVREVAGVVGGGFRRIRDVELDESVKGLAGDVRAALDQAIAAVATVHRAQIPEDVTVSTFAGVNVTRTWSPLRRVGAYVPGGKAAYPSTVVMTVVPARVAGVDEIVVVSPEGPDGTVPGVMLAACRLAGATEVWAIGGAQAVAALAYGTESVEPVEKIVGPGNAWVTAAKLEVFGTCAIDLPAGPSEVLVLADGSADPALVATDLLCQAEHGPDSPAVLVTTDADLVEEVELQLGRLLPELERADILGKALADHGLAVVASSRDDAIAFANEYAAEHVTVVTADAETDAAAIRAAGSIYVGRWAPESAGDYATGANHVLPTGGLAGACGPLSTADFGSWRQIQRIDRTGLEALVPTIAALSQAEGLTAHRLAATIRLEEDQP
ncbi:MAG TPA: histidinol dehydrogenase [Acidimicrobiia bacterium]|nr:histidinol dehydrogenase [Acidimicrobiia bacterium]